MANFVINLKPETKKNETFSSPDWRGKPGAKKIAFLVEKKRLKEALFATLEMHFFCEDLKRKAGNSS
ncbi:hypothetical protein DBR27_18105 [Flavobacterium sp. HMWF030]|nr:hypothetical protein DBR27_18105 [Flavobacterium sp. HMWF030]